MPLIRKRSRVRAVFLLLTAAGFAAMFAISWHQWADLVIDGGREMNTPLRLLRGELIYSDVFYLYGPLAPYLNAALYAVFGVHLNTLYGAGTIASLLTLRLVFGLSRKLTGFRAAAFTTWTVLIFCIFKQNGNYIFPYTYSAVYGTLLGLGALAAQVSYIHRQQWRSLTLAGILTGLALICKLEFGFAAAASLVALAASDAPGARLNTLARGLWPAVAIPAIVYGLLLSMMPWEPLVKDTYLWPGYIPQELIYFNRIKLGLNDPARTLREMLSAVAMLGIAASAVLAAGARLGGASVRGVLGALPQPWGHTLAILAVGSAGVLLINVWIYGTRWDVSPLRALPVLCAGVIGYCVTRRGGFRQAGTHRRSLFVAAVYALAVLARVVLRVPSGGGYGSYLLPVPLVIFMHLGTTFYRPVFARFTASAGMSRRMVSALLCVVLTGGTIVIAFRYIRKGAVQLDTLRGAARVSPAERRAFSEALGFIAQHTRPTDYLAAVPEGSSLNFLADRPAPLRYEILTPGFLDVSGERRAIAELEARRVGFIFLLNRPTTEFGCAAFGKDCYRELMGWIEANYEVAAVFGEGASATSQIGDRLIFIKAYRRTRATAAGR